MFGKKKQSRVVITTGDLKREYEILDAVFAIDSSTESWFRGSDPGRAFEGVKKQLAAVCQGLGGDAVVNCQFEYRVAVDPGLLGSKQSIEIFAYGTAVRAGF